MPEVEIDPLVGRQFTQHWVWWVFFGELLERLDGMQQAIFLFYEFSRLWWTKTVFYRIGDG